MNLWTIFLTGLTTGGLACIAVQGGLLAGYISTQHPISKGATAFPTMLIRIVSLFLASKLISHILLGIGLGALGSSITLSLEVRLVFQFLASLFMIATAGNLLDIHPIFRYAVLQPPHWLTRSIRRFSKDDSWFVPIGLGASTVLIPCGVTQAMEVLAINSASPMLGGAILGVFVLGTIPLFTLLAVTTHALSTQWNERLRLLTAGLLLFLGLYGINGILIVLDSPYTAEKIWRSIQRIGEPPEWYGTRVFAEEGFVPMANGVQLATIEVKNAGYSPERLIVRKNIPVKLTLTTKGVYSCATSFTLRKFQLVAQLQPVDTQSFTFTPTEVGEFSFSCSMGMYQGVLEVR